MGQFQGLPDRLFAMRKSEPWNVTQQRVKDEASPREAQAQALLAQLIDRTQKRAEATARQQVYALRKPLADKLAQIEKEMEAIGAQDVVFESNGIRVAVDPTSLPHVQGTTLDVVHDGLARRLRFDNPNAASTCGCGESFGT